MNIAVSIVDAALSRSHFLVEAKLSETEPAPALIKMKKALGIPAVQLVNAPGISRKAAGKGEGILVASADRWLAGLP